MKQVKLLFTPLFAGFLISSPVFGQQDTTVVVTTNGDVGIGTSMPKARLHVFAPEGSNGLWIRAGDGAEDVLFHVEDSDGAYRLSY